MSQNMQPFPTCINYSIVCWVQHLLTTCKHKDIKQILFNFLQKNIDNFIDPPYNKSANDYDDDIEICINNPMKKM